MYKLIPQRKKEFLIVRLCNQIRETRSKTNKKGEGGGKKKKEDNLPLYRGQHRELIYQGQ